MRTASILKDALQMGSGIRRGTFPRWVLRLFQTPDYQESNLAGKRKEEKYEDP
jgi:hypothetical protein